MSFLVFILLLLFLDGGFSKSLSEVPFDFKDTLGQDPLTRDFRQHPGPLSEAKSRRTFLSQSGFRTVSDGFMNSGLNFGRHIVASSCCGGAVFQLQGL